MPNTNALGATSEAMVLAEFVRAGFPVLLQFSGNSRYDLAVEAGGRLLRVQCKTAHRCGWRGSGSCLCFHARSIRYQAGTRIEKSYRGQADQFAAYAPSTRQVYVLAVDEVPETDARLRLAPGGHNNQHVVRLAEDYTLEAWAARQS